MGAPGRARVPAVLSWRWLALAAALAGCATVDDVRQREPVLVVDSRRPPATVVDCVQDDLDKYGIGSRRDHRPPSERLVLSTSALIGPAYLHGELLAEPEGTGSRVSVRPGPVYLGAAKRRIEASVTTCAAR
jgi:hypothetical protein